MTRLKFGFITVNVFGYNHARLLKRLTENDVTINNFNKIKNGECTFNVSFFKRKKCFAILDDMCYNYKVTCEYTPLSILIAVRRRLAFILSVALLLGLFAYSRSFIWQVSFSGNEDVTEKKLITTLKDNNVFIGGKKRLINLKQVENAINTIDGVLDCTVSLSGCKVNVLITEETEFTPLTVFSNNDLVAEYDAEITRIITLSGTANVKVGDKVFKGTPLIRAFRRSADDTQDIPVRCAGEVYGKVNIVYSETFSKYDYQKTYTGKSYATSSISLFGLKLGKQKLKFNNYDKVTTYETFVNSFLPIKYARSTFNEVVYKKVERDVTTTEAEIVSRAQSENVIKFGSRVITVSASTIDIGRDLYTTHVFITAEVPIIKQS